MTANSITVVEINKLKEKNPEADASKTMKGIKHIFITQLVLIVLLIFSFIIRDLLLSVENDWTYFKDVVLILSNAFAIAVFAYFLEALYDMGQSLFALIDFNNKN